MRIVSLAAAAALLAAGASAASAQVATARGFARSGAAGPMTAFGGGADLRNAGGRIPYVRPNVYGGGSLYRYARPPRQFYGYGYGYGRYGRYGYGPGYYGRGYGRGYGYGGYAGGYRPGINFGVSGYID